MVIEKIGLELRKFGTMDSLYKEVDSVLSQPGNAVSGAVAHGLQKMFKVDRHLSVCFIENAAKMCNICIARERMQIYNCLHCMDWNEMLPEYRRTVMCMILDDFRSILQPEKLK